MIKYAVKCQKGHAFEAWFQNSAAFDKQTKRGLVVCPDCGTAKVTKALMAPNVSSATRKKDGKRRAAAESAEVAQSREMTVPPQNQRVASPHAAMPSEMVEMLRKVRREVEAKADYVGNKFAEEARKIHYAEAPERGIYGEASLEDVRDLHEEGIGVLPLPTLPEDRN